MRPSDESGQTLTYDFPLRPGLMVVLRLPIDLSQKEADRLNRFISMLPFGADNEYSVNLESE